jgi:hypothetical protein
MARAALIKEGLAGKGAPAFGVMVAYLDPAVPWSSTR